MKAIKFKKSNSEIAKGQDQYITLHAEIRNNEEGEVISCYQPTFWERVKIMFGENIYLTQLTFGDKLQPQRLDVGYSEKTFSFWEWTEDGGKKDERIVKESNLTFDEKILLDKHNIDYE